MAEERARYVRLSAAFPTVEAGFLHSVGSVAALPHEALPGAAAVAAPIAVRRAERARELELAPAQPDRQNSARWNCPRTSGPATAVPSGPRRPARLTA